VVRRTPGRPGLAATGRSVALSERMVELRGQEPEWIGRFPTLPKLRSGAVIDDLGVLREAERAPLAVGYWEARRDAPAVMDAGVAKARRPWTSISRSAGPVGVLQIRASTAGMSTSSMTALFSDVP